MNCPYCSGKRSTRDELRLRCICDASSGCSDSTCLHYVRAAGHQYFVRSADGADYKVGKWKKGVWTPGTKRQAYRELALLNEPGAVVVNSRGVEV